MAIRSKLSPQQLEFLDDPYRFKVLVAGRRGGKSFVDGAYLIINALIKPGTKSAYLSLTRESSKNIIWPILTTFLNDCGIPHTLEVSTLTVKFPNGSAIQVTGADMVSTQHRLRGQKFSLVVIDEVGFFAGLGSLVEALLPSLADYKGTMAMSSSPGELLSGVFYEAYAGAMKDSWHAFHWDLRQNPHFMGPATDPKYTSSGEEELDTICRLQFGGDRSHPAFVREYLGLYVKDATHLVYPTGPQNVGKVDMPASQVSLGVRLGDNGQFGAATIEHSEYSRSINVLNTMTGNFARAEDVEILRTWYSYSSIRRIDVGDLTDAVLSEISKRFDLGFSLGDTSDKPFYQLTFRDDLVKGHVKVKDTLPILTEWSRIVRDGAGVEVDDGGSRLMSDACLVLYRTIYTSHLRNWAPPATPEELMIASLIRQAREESEAIEEFDAYE